MRGLTSVTDFFILATCTSERHMKAVAEELRVTSKHAGNQPLSIEGLESTWWVLIDLNHVIVHLMTDEARRYYDLDSLWGDAPRFAWVSDG